MALHRTLRQPIEFAGFGVILELLVPRLRIPFREPPPERSHLLCRETLDLTFDLL